MQPHCPMTTRQRILLAVTVLMVLTVTGFVIGCDSDDTPTVTAPSGGGSDPGSGGGSGTLPSELTPRAAPQESGSDIRGIEVAGLGNITALGIRNTLGSPYTVNVGTWYEPKDGNVQRMIVTRTTTIPSGQTRSVPVACMQQSKDAPYSGIRFFSQSKNIRSGIQTCQQQCLTGSDIQRCVWNCEGSAGSGTPDSQAADIGSRCLELTSERSRNACTNYDIIVGVQCEGDTSFRRVIRYSAGQTGSRNQARCSSGISRYSSCAAPARPRSTGVGTYQCYRT